MHPESRETGTRDRSPLTWLVAAAAVVLIAAAGIFGMAQRDHGSPPAAQESVTQLGCTPPRGRCQVPNVGVLQQQTVAFRGTLVSVVDGTATFDVTHWYRGGPTDTAKITATPSNLATLVQAADLTVGGELSRHRRWRQGARLRLHRSRRADTCRRCTTGPSVDPPQAAGLTGWRAWKDCCSPPGPAAGWACPRRSSPTTRGSWLLRGVATLRDGGCARVTVVLGAEAERARPLLDGARTSTVVVADDWAEGMGASLRAGLRSLAGSADAGVVVSLVDLPDLVPEVVARVVARRRPVPRRWPARRTTGVPGHPVLLGRDHWAGVIESAVGDQGARAYLARRDVTLVECGDLATGRDVDSR